MKLTMVDANDLRPECLSPLCTTPRRSARISSLQRRSTEPTQHGQRRSQNALHRICGGSGFLDSGLS
jgi:hypothetical protein